MIEYTFTENNNLINTYTDVRTFVNFMAGMNDDAKTEEGYYLADIFSENPFIKIGDFTFSLNDEMNVLELLTLVSCIDRDSEEDMRKFDNLDGYNYFDFFEADVFFQVLAGRMDKSSIEYAETIYSVMDMEEAPSSFKSMGMMELISIASNKDNSKELDDYIKSFEMEELTYIVDHKRDDEVAEKPHYSPFQKKVLQRCKETTVPSDERMPAMAW